jgi:hypothetical protein
MVRVFNYKIISVLMILSSFACKASNTNFLVIDVDNKPLSNIVVFAEPEIKPTVAESTLSVPYTAIMDQVNRQFSPHILVVNKNTNIDFPNSDRIKHHVYSFSPAKTFEIQLYREKKLDPRLFDKVGEVILGCNIHDWMVGYVYVVDTPWFGKTDGEGNINLALPDGKYTLKIWHPLLQEADQSFTQKITVSSHTNITINVKEAMKPRYAAYEDDDELDDY